MILLDTNVVSELMKPRPDPGVVAFLDRGRLDELFMPSLVVAEIRYGLRRLPDGQRRNTLETAFEAFLRSGFAGRVLAFDAACAAREAAGRPVTTQDALIGGMALAHGATVATRNTADFDGYGLTLVNPWRAT